MAVFAWIVVLTVGTFILNEIAYARLGRAGLDRPTSPDDALARCASRFDGRSYFDLDLPPVTNDWSASRTSWNP
jgi:hypothetical protein